MIDREAYVLEQLKLAPSDAEAMESLICMKFRCSWREAADVIGDLLDKDLITYTLDDHKLRLGECKEGECVV